MIFTGTWGHSYIIKRNEPTAFVSSTTNEFHLQKVMIVLLYINYVCWSINVCLGGWYNGLVRLSMVKKNINIRFYFNY